MVIAGNPNDAHGVARVTMGKISEVTNGLSNRLDAL